MVARRMGLAPLLDGVRDAADGVFLAARRPPLHVIVSGIRLYGFLRHRSFLESCAKDYEPLTRRLFTDALRPGMTVVDGGAHVGLYTILAGRHLSEGRVLAFEPDPYSFAALSFNIRRSRIANVTLARQALAGMTGTATLHVSAGTIASSLIEREDVGRVRRVPVQTIALEDVIASPIGDLLIKLDLEGAEPAALGGMGRVLQEARSVVLFCEVNPPALAADGTTPAALISQLHAAGLSVAFIDERAARLSTLSATADVPKGNLYCVRPPAGGWGLRVSSSSGKPEDDSLSQHEYGNRNQEPQDDRPGRHGA